MNQQPSARFQKAEAEETAAAKAEVVAEAGAGEAKAGVGGAGEAGAGEAGAGEVGAIGVFWSSSNHHPLT